MPNSPLAPESKSFSPPRAFRTSRTVAPIAAPRVKRNAHPVVAADIRAADTVVVAAVAVNARCSKPFAANADGRRKFRSNHAATSRFIAATASSSGNPIAN